MNLIKEPVGEGKLPVQWNKYWGVKMSQMARRKFNVVSGFLCREPRDFSAGKIRKLGYIWIPVFYMVKQEYCLSRQNRQKSVNFLVKMLYKAFLGRFSGFYTRALVYYYNGGLVA